MRYFILIVTILISSCWVALPVFAQTSLSLDGFSSNPDGPIEMAADKLTVSQTDGSAQFEGNVLISSEDIKILAELLVVTYLKSGGINQLRASGGVTVVTKTESAEATTAVYDLVNQNLILRGDVLLTQGQNAISSDTMTIDLTTGAAVIEGRVRTVLSSESK